MQCRLGKQIKRSLLFLLGLFFLSLVFVLDALQPRLSQGAVLPSRLERSLLLSGGELSQEEGCIRYRFRGPLPETPMELTAVYSLPFYFSVNGICLYDAATAKGEQRILSVSLEDAALSEDGSLLLSFRPTEGGQLSTLFTRHSFFLSPLGTGQKLLYRLNFARSLQIGFFPALFLFGITLFCFKRDEDYLLKYSILVLFLSITAVALYHAGTGSSSSGSLMSLRFLKRFLGVMMPGLECIVFYSLAGMESYPRPSMLKLNRLFLLGLFNGLILFLDIDRLNYFMLLFFRSLSLFYAFYACFHLKKGQFFFTALFLFTQCFWAAQTLSDRIFHCQNLFFQCFVTPPVTDIPFALFCMVITNRRFAEKFTEAQELNIYLDKKVEERSSALLTEQQQKHQLMINIFHDLRSPVFVVKGCFRMLKEERPENLRPLSIIKEQVDLIGTLTEDLFFLAKLENHKILFQEDSVDIKPLLERLADGARILCREKELELVFYAPENGRVEGDALRLERAFSNILSNSIKHARPKSPVELSLERDETRLRIRFRNQGETISEADLCNIFNRYYSSNSAGREGSSGLGLAIADEIVRHHQGRILVKSDKESGTEFTVELPLL